ncbi:hypothetical protein CC78DRAFT_606966 [Lojkania enalia]|uniref:NACHT domain-containing protein n=1 Tax=Lojkania enalia TaxID=147567 RepID=A0A9P4N9F2_9PLEO|nr:hypothetical protein CC78DRAFT_606966 [Didymosphaeria enalia]
MMEPLSILAVAAAVVQFLDFTWKIVTHGNAPNSTSRKDDLAQAANKLRRLSKALGQSKELRNGDNDIYRIREACQTIQAELTAVLDRIKDTRKERLDVTAHSTSRRWTSVRQGLENILGGRKLAEIEKRLESLRQDLLMVVLLELSPSEQRSIEPSAEPIGLEFLESIDEKERWQNDLIDKILNSEGLDMTLFSPSSLGRCTVKYFLENLAYREMFVRVGQIPYAFDNTFRWLFQPDDRQQSWPNFRAFLANESSGSYWITGKPGSGKSTLMKNIASREETQQELRRWAKNTGALVQASFYFWSGASRLNKSREGLLRSLLSQIFQQYDNLIPVYCPRRAEIHTLFGKYTMPWEMEELQDVMFKVLQDSEKKFFFVIDGLDECVDDHEELVALLREISGNSNVKMCLSSRPWSDFLDNYKHGPHLKLHELTTSDIEHFVNSKLRGSSGFADLQMSDRDFAASLIEEITQKSQGVFIWVNIVVHAIIADLKAGKRIATLQSRLQELPGDLEELFQKLLDMIEEGNKEDAYQIFRLAQVAHTPITLLTLVFAQGDGDLEDGNAFINSKFVKKRLTVEEKEGHCNRMKRRLTSHCMDLLEVVAPSKAAADILDLDHSTTPDLGTSNVDSQSHEGEFNRRVDLLSECTVQYMHRTVKDFLARPNIWVSFSQAITSSSFDPYEALSRASIIHLKNIDIHYMTTAIFWRAVEDTLYYATLSDIQGQNPLITELDELDRTANEIARTQWLKEPRGNLIQRHNGIPLPHQRVPRRIREENEHASHWSAAQAKGGSKHSFLCLAVQFGLCSYVQFKLEAGSAVEQPQGSRSLLDCAIREHESVSILRSAPLTMNQRISMIKLLLEKGDNPNRRDPFQGTPWLYLEGQITNSLKEGTMKDQNSHIKRPLQQKKIDIERVEFWLSAAELFVKYDANCWAVNYKPMIQVLGIFDEQRAAVLKKAMKGRRRSLSHIWTTSVRKKNDAYLTLGQEDTKSIQTVAIVALDDFTQH